MTGASEAVRDSAQGRESPANGRTGYRTWVILAVFACFLLSSAVRRPVPSVNEPHYLGKAKHYWTPEWCAGDLFLESSNPHLVFYQTVGLLTQWFTLTATAWMGRVLALGLLAWGWTRLMSRLLDGRWSPLAAALVFLLLQSLGDFSGEWLVGGVESKVFAYAFAMAALADFLDRRFLPAGVWMGLAVSFHPVVGVWCVIAALMTIVAGRLPWTRDLFGGKELPIDWKNAAAGIALLFLCSLPGLIPAAALLSQGDAQAGAEANLIQVGERLAHHLDPMQFPLSAYRYYALQLVLTWLLWKMSRSTPARRWFAGFVGAAVVIAVVGALIGWGPRPLANMPLASLRVKLLTFYPFRLADAFVPILLSVMTVAAVRTALESSPRTSWRRRLAFAAFALSFVVSLVLPTADRRPSRMSSAAEADWLAMCEWLRTQTPTDALLYTANRDWAVKWFAERAEYVNYKDCPQDAAGILEWARRRQVMNDWAEAAFADGRCSQEDLERLYRETGITYLTASRLGPIDVEPVYRNDTFRVYALGPK